VKDRWTQVTGEEAIALIAGGKYRGDKPFWVRRDGVVWALVNEQFLAWRASQYAKGVAK
jgi:hypothetical protein